MYLLFQVEWFMQQKEKKYQIFSTRMMDPLFDKQWYIVSCPLYKLTWSNFF